jgi:prophage tail gpP-like protein
MAEPTPDLPLTIILEPTGSLQARNTIALESWSLDSQYLVPTDGWEAVVYEGEAQYKAVDWDLRPVTLELDGQKILLGRIEVTEVGGRGSAVTLRGRDWIADLCEGNVDPTVAIRDEMTLETALLMVGSPYGVYKIVDDQDDNDAAKRIGTIRAGSKKKGKSNKAIPLKDYQPKPGESAMQYMDRLCMRLGMTIQPGPDRGTLFITSPFYDEPPLYRPLQRYRERTLNTGNNVIKAVAVRDYSRMPTFALATGTAASSGKKGEPVSKDIDVFGLAGAGEIGEVIADKMVSGRKKFDESASGEEQDASDVQLYRMLYFRDPEARTQEQLEHSIRRAVADRMKDTLSYRCTVKGFKDPVTDALWAVDHMVEVVDEICGINEPLWIAKRTFRFDQTNGATTDLELWRPHSFPFFDETTS